MKITMTLSRNFAVPSPSLNVEYNATTEHGEVFSGTCVINNGGQRSDMEVAFEAVARNISGTTALRN